MLHLHNLTLIPTQMRSVKEIAEYKSTIATLLTNAVLLSFN